MHDPEITARGSGYRHLVRVEVTLKDGNVLEETRDSYRGTEKDFGQDSDLIEKFEKLTYPRMPAERANRLRDLVLDLENLEHIRELTSLLTTNG